MRIEPAIRIALIYAIISLFYLFVSDSLVDRLVADVNTRLVQTTKGTAFVLFSALVIYLLIRSELQKRQRLRDVAMRAQRLEAIGQFSTVMAHDFNNMLMVVIGALEVSEDTLPPDHPARAHLANALKASEKAGALTHRMLIFSRQGHLPAKSVDVNESARELAPLLNVATGQNVSLHCNLSEGLPPVIAEPCKFQNILLNLIINARDAMPNGGDVVLETARERVESQLTEGLWIVPPGDYVTIVVRDTGHGMSKHVMSKVLEPFFTTKPFGKGTGLGLTTLREGLDAWQGHLIITSASGVGTNVKMYLKIAESDDAATPALKSADIAGGTKGETILLVENDPEVCAAVSNQLQSLGYKVHTAATVTEARLILKNEGKVDLLLCDIYLDGTTSGAALAKQARTLDKDLKLILMSGYSDPGLTADLTDLSGLGWLAKPFDRSALRRELRKLLD